MKKTLKILTAVIIVSAMCVFFAACSTNVEGNTYTFSDVEVTSSDEGYTAEMLATQANDFKESMQGFSITFQADGIVVMSAGNSSNTMYYEQNGNTVSVYEDAEHTDKEVEITVSGSSIYWLQEYSSVTVKIIFKK